MTESSASSNRSANRRSSRRNASVKHSLNVLNEQIVSCERCPELREYCAEVGRTKRRAFADWEYWARPVPSFGDPLAKIVIVGLAPAAHGANRTGRMFTGDRSGDFLYAALYRAGLANQAEATNREDGLALKDVYITAALRCAPPGNRPTTAQLANCRQYLVDELRLMKPRVILALGSIGWNAALAALADCGIGLPVPKPKFGHAAEFVLDETTLIGCYHVSQQNTFTGRLTASMLERVLARARQCAAVH